MMKRSEGVKVREVDFIEAVGIWLFSRTLHIIYATYYNEFLQVPLFIKNVMHPLKMP